MVPATPPDEGKTTDDLIQRLGREIKQQPPVSPPDSLCPGGQCTSTLIEDPAVSCYRHIQAPVVDSLGVVHNESLYVQLGLAAGIQFAQLQSASAPGTAERAAYNCGGTFYERNGARMRVPAFPARARSDEDVKAWKASVSAFYAGASLDSKGKRFLSPGKAQLCVKWAEVHFQTNPDPSLLQALEMLQRIGAEENYYHQDRTWQTSIFAAGTTKGCPTPVLPPQHDIESWFVPMSSARLFHKAFRDCNQPDTSGVGGCPHKFDAGTGNHVNARYLFDGDTPQHGRVSVFIGDAPQRCGPDCYPSNPP